MNARLKKVFTPRGWQAEALSAYEVADQNDFLAMVSPGGGKTNLGLMVASVLPDIERVIVVCPTITIKDQWKRVAGDNFKARFSDLQECASNHLVTTYQEVAAKPDLFAELSSEVRSIVIFDEVHHCGDNSWGSAAQHAFDGAFRRLSLTGTAFRSDGNPIPFLRYVDGVCSPDYIYGYGRSVLDGHCRRIKTKLFGGELKWVRLDKEEEKEATFDDKLADTDARHRLRAALDPRHDFLRSMLRSANSDLNASPGEGGLVICYNTKHASAVAKALQEETGHKPVIVHSGLSGAHKRIEKFAESKDRWLVSVDMVSEGVDIPRLRSLVYATNKSTELYVRQAIGRVIRGEGEALLYFPAHPSFTRILDGMEEDRLHVLSEASKESDGRPGVSSERVDIEVLEARSWVVVDGIELRGEGMKRAMEISEEQVNRRRERDCKSKRELRKDPSYRERLRERRRERYKTDPSYRERLLELGRERCKDPSCRERRRERYKTDPSYRERLLERESERRKDPRCREQQRKRKHIVAVENYSISQFPLFIKGSQGWKSVTFRTLEEFWPYARERWPLAFDADGNFLG